MLSNIRDGIRADFMQVVDTFGSEHLDYLQLEALPNLSSAYNATFSS
jgi:hypothetical protein